MSKYTDDGKAFPDTHRDFRLTIEISRKCPIVFRGLAPNRSNFKKQVLLDSQSMSFEFVSCSGFVYLHLYIRIVDGDD